MNIAIKILITFLIVMVLQFNAKLQEEYEVIRVTTTMNVQPLIDAGYLVKEPTGFFVNTVFSVLPCPVCEAIKSGNITFTSGFEPSDNFTIIPNELPFYSIFRGIE